MVEPECRISPEADEDLAEIWDFISRDNIDAADRWDAKLRETFAFLSKNPHAGHPRKDLTDKDVLFWPVAKYLIIYAAHGEDIEIVAVTQSSRDIPPWLRKRS